MKHPSSYLKLRILAAIDYAEGKTHNEKIKNVAAKTFINVAPYRFHTTTILTHKDPDSGKY